MNSYHNRSKKTLSSLLLLAVISLHISPLVGFIVYAEEATTTSSTSTTEQTSLSSEIPLLGSESAPVETNPASEPFLSAPDQGTTTLNNTEEETSSDTLDSATSSPSAPPSTGQELQQDTASSSASSTSPGPTIPGTVTSTDSSTPTFSSTGTSTAGTTTQAENTPTQLATSSFPLEMASSTEDLLVSDGDEDIASTTEDVDTGTSTLPAGTTTISTGEAVAMANILNLLNTNIVNSTGSIILANLPDGQEGNIDLRSSPSSTESGCTLLGCNGIDTIDVNLESDATIENDISVTATSGANLIDTAETAAIDTGSSSAGLNLVNVANTNVVDSNYLLVSLNSFDTVNGDIVFPSISSFFSPHNSMSTPSQISAMATGTVENDLTVDASTGSNQNSAVQGTTTTGDAVSSTNIYNALNSLLVGGNSISLLLKVSGTWVGELFGLPSGNTFTEEGNVRLLQFEENGSSSNTLGALTNVESTSTALISNNVDVLANSGENGIANAGTSTITTGTARAAANVINIANANIVGRNWILAIINIFGDFNGNISFGKPDLWLGEKVSASASFIENGTVLTYTITTINRGDLAASDVRIASSYDHSRLNVTSSSMERDEVAPGNMVFRLGTLAPNEAKEITFQATIKDTTPGTNIINTSIATAHEPDNNTSDNMDSTTITTSVITQGGGGTLPAAPQTVIPAVVPTTPTITSIDPLTIAVVRTTASTTITEADTPAEQVLVIRNLSGNTIPSAIFDDVLTDEAGNELRRENWDLGQLLPYEEVTVSYDISFGEQAPSGTFALTSEFRYSGDQRLTFASNGSLVYTAPKRIVRTAGVAGTGAFSPPTPVVSSIKKATSSIERNTDRGAVLGAFAGPFSPEIAYAESGSSSLSLGKNPAYYALYLFIFLLVMVPYVLYRQTRR